MADRTDFDRLLDAIREHSEGRLPRAELANALTEFASGIGVQESWYSLDLTDQQRAANGLQEIGNVLQSRLEIDEFRQFSRTKFDADRDGNSLAELSDFFDDSRKIVRDVQESIDDDYQSALESMSSLVEDFDSIPYPGEEAFVEPLTDLAKLVYTFYALVALRAPDNADSQRDAEGHIPPEAAEPFAPLTYSNSIGDSPEAVAALTGQIERLIGSLHRAAHDPNTSDETSVRLTNHARTGHQLVFGRENAPPSTPPEPALLFGWTVGAARLLSITHGAELPPAAEAAVKGMTDDPTPDGLRKVLNTAAEVGGSSGPGVGDGGRADTSMVRRLASALSELVSIESVGGVVAVQYVLANLGVAETPSWVLASITVLLLLVKRRET